MHSPQIWDAVYFLYVGNETNALSEIVRYHTWTLQKITKNILPEEGGDLIVYRIVVVAVRTNRSNRRIGERTRSSPDVIKTGRTGRGGDDGRRWPAGGGTTPTTKRAAADSPAHAAAPHSLTRLPAKRTTAAGAHTTRLSRRLPRHARAETVPEAQPSSHVSQTARMSLFSIYIFRAEGGWVGVGLFVNRFDTNYV